MSTQNGARDVRNMMDPIQSPLMGPSATLCSHYAPPTTLFALQNRTLFVLFTNPSCSYYTKQFLSVPFLEVKVKKKDTQVGGINIL